MYTTANTTKRIILYYIYISMNVFEYFKMSLYVHMFDYNGFVNQANKADFIPL